MTDEEKKAIERIEDFLTTNIIISISNDETANSEELKAFISKNEYLSIEFIAAMFLKQQKEIEELSDKLTEKICKGVEEEILEEYRQTIINKDKEIEKLKEVKWYYEISRVPKDKIKAKIEELDFMIKEINQGHLQKYTVGELLSAKRFLQSLLEKE